MTKNEINALFKEIAQYRMLEAEAKAMREEAEAKVKAYLEAEGMDTLIGDEHKATYKEVKSTTFDKVGIIGRLAELTDTTPDAIKKLYTIPNPTKRFTFA